MHLVKKIMIWVVLGAAFYALIGFHYFYFGGTRIRVLKKVRLTLVNTFNDFSSSMITNKKILSDPALRDAGVADLLISMGRMTEAEHEKIMQQLEAAER